MGPEEITHEPGDHGVDAPASNGRSWRSGRRGFFGVAAIAAGASMLPSRASASGRSTSAFAIDAAPGVRVKVGQGRLFPLTVLDADDNVLEHYQHVSTAWIGVIDSPHFTVRSITPPTQSAVA